MKAFKTNQENATEKSQWHRTKLYAYLTILVIMVAVVLVNGTLRKFRNGVDVEDKILVAMDSQLKDIFDKKDNVEILKTGTYELVEVESPAMQRLNLAETRYKLTQELASFNAENGETTDNEAIEKARREYEDAKEAVLNDTAEKEKNYYRNIRFKKDGKTYSGYQKMDPDLKKSTLVQVVEITAINKDIEKAMAGDQVESFENGNNNNLNEKE